LSILTVIARSYRDRCPSEGPPVSRAVAKSVDDIVVLTQLPAPEPEVSTVVDATDSMGA